MRKLLIYSLLAVALFGLLGVGVVSAHGWFIRFSDALPGEIAQRAETMFQNKANLLGISVDEMKDAWAEGKTLMEIAEEQGITQEQFQERMRELRKERLQTRLQVLVDGGVISQEQANQRLQAMEERFENENSILGRSFRRGFGGCGW